MARKTGKGKISFRGILALAIGLVWVWFALNPERYGNDNTPPFPLLIRAILFIGGVALIYGGIGSLRFVWQRSGLIGSQPSVPAEICVLEDDDDDRGTETVHVRLAGRCQAVDVERSGKVRKYVDGKVRWGEVWLKPEWHGSGHHNLEGAFQYADRGTGNSRGWLWKVRTIN